MIVIVVRVASNLECIGLAVSRAGFDALVRDALAAGTSLGTWDGVEVYRWTDASGAGLVLGLHGDELADFIPCFAGTPGARLAEVTSVNAEVFLADVVDDEDLTATRMAVELVEYRRAVAGGGPVAGRASVAAFGVKVSVFADEEAFARSDASLLDPGRDPGDPPDHYRERGWSWPPRLAAESFISHGAFGSDGDASAHAHLSGTVLRAESRTNGYTGQEFAVVRVRSVGFEADLCMPVPDGGVPVPGAVIAGTVFLVASMPHLAA